MTFLCQVDVGSVRNLICVPFIEVVIDWFSAVMWGAIKMSNSPVGGDSEFSCPRESVDQGMRGAGTFCYK